MLKHEAAELHGHREGAAEQGLTLWADTLTRQGAWHEELAAAGQRAYGEALGRRGDPAAHARARNAATEARAPYVLDNPAESLGIPEDVGEQGEVIHGEPEPQGEWEGAWVLVGRDDG